ncbi:MAG: cytochrome c family protein [Hyphomicrobiales bacterium]|nr:cytochrome c family protein [Hyphomicrobiales bacterium]
MKKFILAAIAAAALAAPAAAQSAGDPVKGEQVFKKCKACHQVGEGAKNGVGPLQNGIVGRKAGSVPDYKYSNALIEAGAKGLVWDEANLDKYLADPRGFLPGNKMAFVGLKKEDERADVIAYLKTLK